jgi:hypothetical protein
MKTYIQRNSLRIKTAVVLLSLIGCLISCKSENDPEKPAQPSQNPLTEKAKEIATFLTDNYSIGDSVFFRRETGETEGFMVTQNHFSATNEDLSEYLLETSMESKETTFDIRISVTEPVKDFFYVDGIFSINHDNDVKPYIYTSERGDSIIIMTNSGKLCTLRRNVGLGYAFHHSYLWDLIR